MAIALIGFHLNPEQIMTCICSPESRFRENRSLAYRYLIFVRLLCGRIKGILKRVNLRFPPKLSELYCSRGGTLYERVHRGTLPGLIWRGVRYARLLENALITWKVIKECNHIDPEDFPS